MLSKKHLIGSFIIVVSFLFLIGCENDSNSPTKPLTQPTYGTVAGFVYFAGTSSSTVSGVTVNCGGISTTTSIDGKFILKNVPSGNQVLKAEKTDFEPFERNVEVMANDSVRYDIDLTSASTIKNISGTVFQKDNNQLLDSVRVILINDTTFTDAVGKYQLPLFSQGLKTIKAEKTGYKSFSSLVFISNSDIEYDIKLEKLP